MLATVLGSGLSMLDSTVVNVALPALGANLDASLGDLQWVVNGYTLSLAALILLGGSLGDRFGRRRIFVVGVVWFAAGSLLCGLSPTIDWLIAARILQGVGGALLVPGSLAIISATFVRSDRARAIGSWSALAGVATAAGPLLGGWMVQTIGWRWVFLINLPLAVIVLVVALRHVPETADPSAPRSFDLVGAALGALGLAALTYALIGAGDGWSLDVVLVGVLGVAALVAFVVVERRESHPMLPMDIFASRQFSAANVVTLLVYAALGAMFFLLVVQLQVVAGFGALAAGSALLPITIIMLLLSSASGQLAERIGPRLPMTVGPLLAGDGIPAAAENRPGHLVRDRRAARRRRHRARTRPDRGSADRDRAGRRRRSSRRHRQRRQQRRRPRRRTARRRGDPGCWSASPATPTPNQRCSTPGSTGP